MKIAILGLALLAGAAIGVAAPAHAENAMYTCQDSSDVVALTNVPQGADCEKLFSYASPAPSAQATAQPAAVAPVARVASNPAQPASVGAGSSAKPVAAPAAANATRPHPVSKSLMEQRRDDAIQQTRDAYNAGQAMAGVNPAVNRRYLMTSRLEYQKAIGAIP